MRRCLCYLIAIAAFCSVVFVGTRINVADDAKPAEELVIIVYPAADLPVWSMPFGGNESMAFDPSLLTALIKSTIDPESWKEGRGSISSHEESVSLVIRTTRDGHQKIANLFQRHRAAGPQEVKKEID